MISARRGSIHALSRVRVALALAPMGALWFGCVSSQGYYSPMFGVDSRALAACNETLGDDGGNEISRGQGCLSVAEWL